MAENIQRSTGRPENYKFDRGGTPAEMGPYIGIVVNNVDNTRSGRLQVWIEQFGSTNVDGTPNLNDPSTWRTVRYCSPFYGATKQSGAAGTGTYPGNRNTYGMWFTPPELGTQVLCFFVSGDPTMGGYYIGCIPEDGLNHMIPAIGASSNYQTNNATQQQYLNGVPSAPVTEINDIDTKITDNPRFFEQKKPVQSTVEGILIQQGLNKDPVRGPIKSSSQRESPSNCYGISTPGKPIYQGGYSDKTFKQALEKGQVKLQDIAVIGRQGGHTFVMDDGDIDGNDTLVRIRTAKGHQITMSDNGDAFFITHANGQTWIELGKQGTVDVYSTNSINLRSEGVLNFHGDKGINMYSGGTIRVKSKKSTLLESAESLLMNSEKYTLLSGNQNVGVRSTGSLALQSKSGSWNSGAQLNFKAGLINLNGAATTSVADMPAFPNLTLADTAYVAGQGWTVKPNSLETIVTRAPTHQPYANQGQGADVQVNLNPTEVVVPSATSASAKIYEQVNATSVQNELNAEQLSKEQPSTTGIGPLSNGQVTALTAATATNHAAQYPAYDDDGNLMPDFAINEETGEPYYIGPDLDTIGIGKYGQTVDGVVTAGLVKPNVLDLVKQGISLTSILSSVSAWTGQLGIGSLINYLTSPSIQNSAQIGLMASAYSGLLDAGVITGQEDARFVATFLQPATEYGVYDVVQWVDGYPTTTPVEDLISSARRGQYAIDFYQYYGPDLKVEALATAAENTLDATQRDVIDQAVADIIGNPKVPVPQYTDIPTVVSDTTAATVGVNTELQIQPDDTILKVPVVVTNAQGDGTFRLAPGNSNKQG